MRHDRLSSRAWGFVVAAIGVCGTVLLAEAAAVVSGKPNVLFIAVDDLNDWTGALGGHPQARTPHLDRLAGRGVLFKYAYCAAPACNPSRAALLTGIRPATSGVYHNNQPWRPAMREAVTLPAHFKAHGYRAIGGGKIFHGGYDDDASWDHYVKKGRDPVPSPETQRDPRSRSGGIVWGALDVPDRDMDDYRIVSWAIEELEKDQDKPFFLACGIYRPHMPWQVPRAHYDMFPPDKVILPEAPEEDLSDIPEAGIRMARPEGDHATMLKTGNWRHAVQAYLASIHFADAQVGRLLDALDRSGHGENTIIVLWGDHGWHLGEKRHWRKFALWEEATRTPLIFVVPGVSRPGGVCEHPVDLLNVYPTLADLCGLPLVSQLEGISLKPLLQNPQTAWDRPALTTHGRNNHAIRLGHWRYIGYADGSEELYDHAADPMEWRNLAADPAYASSKAKLVQALPKLNAADAPSGNRNPRRQGRPANIQPPD